MKSYSLSKVGSIIVLIVLLSKVLAFVKQLLVAWFYGSNVETDIYFLADSSVALVSSAISVGIGTSVLSHYIKEKENKGNLKILTNNIITYGLLLCSIVSIIIIACSDMIADVLAGSKFSIDKLNTLSLYIKILSFTIISMTIAAVLGSILEGNRIFIPTKIQSAIVSVITIVFTIIGGINGEILFLVYGYLFSYFIYLVYIIFICKKNNLLPSLSIPSKDKRIVDIVKMAVPVIISITVVDINHMVDKIVAARVDIGVVSSLYYAQLASVDLLASVFIFSFSGILINKFSTSAVKNDTKTLVAHINKVLDPLVCVALLLCVAYSLYSDFFSELVFGYFSLKMDKSSVRLIGTLMSVYAWGLMFIPFREILIRVFYSYQNSRIPLMTSIISVITNIALTFLLARCLGAFGIPMATNISIIINIVLLIAFVRRYINNFSVDIREFLKYIFAAIFIFFIGFFIKQTYDSYTINLFVLFLLCILYFVILYLSKSKIIILVCEKMKNYISK